MIFTYTKKPAFVRNSIRRVTAATLVVALALGTAPVATAFAAESQSGSGTQQVDGIQLTGANPNGGTCLAVASVLAEVSENAVPAVAAVSAEVAQEQTAKESKTQKLLSVAESLTGTPYVYGGSTPAGFDCSGFTQYVYGKMGVNLTHNAQAQYNETKSVDVDDLQAGDLVFFGSSTGSITHVGIYVGDGEFIHSPQTGEYVRTDSLSDRSNFVGATRPSL